MANWAVGFTMGLLTVLAAQRVIDEPERLHCEQVRSEVLVQMYQRGRQDALIHSYANFNGLGASMSNRLVNKTTVRWKQCQRCTQRFHWKPKTKYCKKCQKLFL
jgi:hypothetical protein